MLYNLSSSGYNHMNSLGFAEMLLNFLVLDSFSLNNICIACV